MPVSPIILILTTILIINFIITRGKNKKPKVTGPAFDEREKSELKNTHLKRHRFLASMYDDPYFQNDFVHRIEQVLIDLCYVIEADQIKDAQELYPASHLATKQINEIEDEFSATCEIETTARECIALEFDVIAKAYEIEANMEELIAPRNW